MSVYITQLIYLKEGKENIFHQFEDKAMPLITKYRGKLLLRIRPNGQSIIESHTEAPYEVHLVEFASQQDFENFMQDEDRKQFLHWKEESIRSVVLIQGTKL